MQLRNIYFSKKHLVCVVNLVTDTFVYLLCVNPQLLNKVDIERYKLLKIG